MRKRPTHRPLILVLLTAAAIGLAAWGSSGGSATGTTRPATKAPTGRGVAYLLSSRDRVQAATSLRFSGPGLVRCAVHRNELSGAGVDGGPMLALHVVR